MTTFYTHTVRLTVDGQPETLQLDTRTTLLDALRDHIGNMAPKKGCDHGQCGACTVLIDGAGPDGSAGRVLSCLCLAASYDGATVTTAAGLANQEGAEGELSQLQQSFLTHDAFQCGYCTPGQLCSAAGMLSEARAGMPSVVSDLAQGVTLTDSEIRERMSGNLCRCGAYANILPAVREVAQASGLKVSPTTAQEQA